MLRLRKHKGETMTGEEQARENGQAAMRKALAGLEEKYGPAKTNPDGTFEFDIKTPQSASDTVSFMMPKASSPTQSFGAPIVLPSARRRESPLVPVLLVVLAVLQLLELLALVAVLVKRPL